MPPGATLLPHPGKFTIWNSADEHRNADIASSFSVMYDGSLEDYTRYLQSWENKCAEGVETDTEWCANPDALRTVPHPQLWGGVQFKCMPVAAVLRAISYYWVQAQSIKQIAHGVPVEIGHPQFIMKLTHDTKIMIPDPSGVVEATDICVSQHLLGLEMVDALYGLPTLHHDVRVLRIHILSDRHSHSGIAALTPYTDKYMLNPTIRCTRPELYKKFYTYKWNQQLVDQRLHGLEELLGCITHEQHIKVVADIVAFLRQVYF